jgi:hypothetical protein
VITVEGTDMIKADKPLFAFQLKHEVSTSAPSFLFAQIVLIPYIEERKCVLVIRD